MNRWHEVQCRAAWLLRNQARGAGQARQFRPACAVGGHAPVGSEEQPALAHREQQLVVAAMVADHFLQVLEEARGDPRRHVDGQALNHGFLRHRLGGFEDLLGARLEGLNLLGDGLRDALDPTLRGREL